MSHIVLCGDVRGIFSSQCDADIRVYVAEVEKYVLLPSSPPSSGGGFGCTPIGCTHRATLLAFSMCLHGRSKETAQLGGHFALVACTTYLTLAFYSADIDGWWSSQYVFFLLFFR